MVDSVSPHVNFPAVTSGGTPSVTISIQADQAPTTIPGRARALSPAMTASQRGLAIRVSTASTIGFAANPTIVLSSPAGFSGAQVFVATGDGTLQITRRQDGSNISPTQLRLTLPQQSSTTSPSSGGAARRRHLDVSTTASSAWVYDAFVRFPGPTAPAYSPNLPPRALPVGYYADYTAAGYDGSVTQFGPTPAHPFDTTLQFKLPSPISNGAIASDAAGSLFYLAAGGSPGFHRFTLQNTDTL